MSIEGISLEHFSVLPQTEINSSTKSCPRHAVFHYFLSGDIKQYSSTITLHIKRLIGLLKEKIIDVIIKYNMKNTDGYSKQYICASAIYLISVMSQCYSVIIDRGISALGHGK